MTTDKKHVVFLKGKKTILRPVHKETDLDSFVCWFNDPDILRFVRRSFPMHFQEESEWFDTQYKKTNAVNLAIETADKNVLIGVMGLHDINWIDRTAVTGACIGEKEYWGKGYGSDAKGALLRYAFLTLNLRKIYSYAAAFNERSIRYSLKCGYEKEGVLKDDVFREGAYHDVVILSITADKFLALLKDVE